MHISLKDLIVIEILLTKNDESKLDLASSLDSKSADKELQAVTPKKKAKLASPPLPKKLVTSF